MERDKETQETKIDKEDKLPSEKVENAHASGDGSFERSETDDPAKAAQQVSTNEPPY